MTNITLSTPTAIIEPGWLTRVERIRHRLKADPNEQIAEFDMHLRLMSTADGSGAILLKVIHVIDGARGEAKTHKRKVALGSLKYAIAKELEECEAFWKD